MTHSGLCDLGSWKDADEPPTFAAKIYEYSNVKQTEKSNEKDDHQKGQKRKQIYLIVLHC